MKNALVMNKWEWGEVLESNKDQNLYIKTCI